MLTPDTLLQERYQILRLLGEGGMGAVYEGLDLRLDSRIALKQTAYDDALLRRQFEREARMLARLRHPALPRVIDHFQENDGQFLVMEFIPGDDLGQMLKSGLSFGVSPVLHWTDQLLDALEYLHAQNPPIIHRDIKPANLKFVPPNQIILLDFGLAKGTSPQSKTLTGSLFGYSPHYAPLEQINGDGTTVRSDLYSLAATMYHLLSGQKPPDALARVAASINGNPDPLPLLCSVNPEVPVPVAAVFERALSQASNARFASAAEMREALRAAAAGVAIPPEAAPQASFDAVVDDSAPTVVSTRPRPGSGPDSVSDSAPTRIEPLPPQEAPEGAREDSAATIDVPILQSRSGFRLDSGAALLIMLVLLFVLIVGFGYVALEKTGVLRGNDSATAVREPQDTPQPSATPSSSATARPGVTRLVGHVEDVRAVGFTPDSKVLFSGGWDGTIRLWSVLDGRVLRVLPIGKVTINAVRISPDTKNLVAAYFDQSGKSRVAFIDPMSGEVAAGHPVLVDNAEPITGMAFSPDGQLVLGSLGRRINVWDTSSGKTIRVIDLGDVNVSMSLSPDGATLAAASVNQPGVQLWNYRTGKRIGTLPATSGISSLRFSPDGSSLASGSSDGEVRLWDVKERATVWTISHGHTNWVFSLAFSPDGRTLASGSYHEVKLSAVTNGKVGSTIPMEDSGIAYALAFSPDGSMLAVGPGNGPIRVWKLPQ